MVVADGETDAEPLVFVLEVNDAEQEFALDELLDSVLLCPAVIVLGDALKKLITGAALTISAAPNNVNVTNNKPTVVFLVNFFLKITRMKIAISTKTTIMIETKITLDTPSSDSVCPSPTDAGPSQFLPILSQLNSFCS